MFLPFAYTIDQYRWGLFNGSISKDQMTYKWWELRYVVLRDTDNDQLSLII